MFNTRLKFFYCLFSLIILTACSSRPDHSTVTANIADHLVEQHQLRIAHISGWQIRGRIAFFNLVANNRSAASLSWAKTLDHSFLRLSHPLRGTLAQLEQTPLTASLTDNKGEQHQASTIDELLYWQLGLSLPFSLVENSITGKLPEQLGSHFNFYADGTLAEYQLLAANRLGKKQLWQIKLSHYQKVTSSTGEFNLPFELEVTHPDYKIRLQINEWSHIE